MLGDTLRNAHDEGDLSGDGLLDTGSGERGAVCSTISIPCVLSSTRRKQGLSPGSILRNEDGGGIGARFPHTVGNIGKDWKTKVFLAGLLGVGSTDDLCPYWQTCQMRFLLFGAPCRVAVKGKRVAIYRSRSPVVRGNCTAKHVSNDGLVSPFPITFAPTCGEEADRDNRPIDCGKEGQTYVPCLPVKPWKRTLVSLLMRRLSMVAA